MTAGRPPPRRTRGRRLFPVIGLILLDLDGTLVGAGNRVHPQSWTAIKRAQALGIRVAICTGRPSDGFATDYAERIDPRGAHVFENGALIARPDGEMLSARPLSHASFLNQVTLSRLVEQPLEAYTGTTCYVERPTDYTRAHAKIIDITVAERDLFLVDEPIVRVQWIAEWTAWATLKDRVGADPAVDVVVASQPDIPETCFSSVTAKGVSKAAAARWLAAHYGLTIESVAMVGDGDNDLEAIQTVGLGIAMGNGTHAVRAAANAVVRSVDDGGLADAIDLAIAADT